MEQLPTPLPAEVQPGAFVAILEGHFVTSIPPADRHPAKVYLARLAPGSRRAIGEALERLAQLLSGGRQTAETLPWHQLRYQHAQAVRAALAEHYAAATVNKHLAALRGVLKEAWRLGHLSAEEYERAADVKGVRGTAAPRGRALTKAEVRALFEACAKDGGPAGARDAAILAVLYAGGLRRAELVSLELEDYAPTSGALVIRHGKGNKWRTVYLKRGAAKALAAWLSVRGDVAGPVFVPINRHDRIERRAMTDQAILYILWRRAEEARVRRFSPHDLRRTFISDLLDAGADISTVQQLAGHANVQTTARYDRRGEHSKQRAADLLDVPFTGAKGRRTARRKEPHGR
jgi:site-specific recombinase XerD